MHLDYRAARQTSEAQALFAFSSAQRIICLAAPRPLGVCLDALSFSSSQVLPR